MLSLPLLRPQGTGVLDRRCDCGALIVVRGEFRHGDRRAGKCSAFWRRRVWMGTSEKWRVRHGVHVGDCEGL